MTPEVVSLDDLTTEPHAHLFEADEPQTIRLSLDEDERVAPHQHPDRLVVFHLLEGRVEVMLGEQEVTMQAGDVAHFDGAQDISPRALESAEALLVLAKKGED